MALDLVGIHNVGEFYSHHYLTALLEHDLGPTLQRWTKAEDDGGAKAPPKQLAALANRFFHWQAEAAGHTDPAPRLAPARELHAHLLEALGYTRRPGVEEIGDGEVVPVLTTEEHNRRPYLWIVEAPFGLDRDEADPLDEAPQPDQLPKDIGEVKLATETWRELLDGRLLRREDAPRWVIVLAGADVFLVDRDKWPQGKLLHFELGELMSRRQAPAMRAMAGLLHREVLLPETGQSLLDQLDENSHKHAFAVSTDLKYGARTAIELIANEAIHYVRFVRKEVLFKEEKESPKIAKELTRESLVYLYRLLFLFYVEARSAEMEDEHGNAVVPMRSDAYRLGYSLETLRDLEQVPLVSVEARNGFFLDNSLRKLFDLVFKGHGYGQRELEHGSSSSDFVISGLRSPLFDESRTPILKSVKLRNEVVQKVLQLLSLSREHRKRGRGRISYATLGINQLGAVYEGLLSYTGFFAAEDLHEIRAAKEMNDPEARTYFVPKAKIGDYYEEEKVKDEKGRPIVHTKGTYLFRLAGRDREKSASYYTPEVLTRCLTKYTLKERLGEPGTKSYVPADEVLQLTVCEPAMGSGAFLNEAVNQLADAYLERKQAEVGLRIPAERMQIERQRVKYLIAANNCYGVDKNPLAAELGKVSLWLNVLQPGVHAPYFDRRIVAGNSLLGARREVFDKADLMKSGGKKGENWLTKVPTRVKFGEKRPEGSVYHFLVPDAGMAPFEKDKVVAQLEPENVKLIKNWRHEISRPFTTEEVARLVDLSNRIDTLWEQHRTQRTRILREIRQSYPVWPTAASSDTEQSNRVPGIEECEERARELDRASSPGVQLRRIFEYWSSLWFWPTALSSILPSREALLQDLEDITANRPPRDETSKKRLTAVREVASREPSFSWDFEFVECFAEREGMQIIVGNPPWISWDWSETDTLGDLDPRIQLRKMTAKAASDARSTILSNSLARAVYLSSYESDTGSAAALSALQSYPTLNGVRTNLYKCFLAQSLRLVAPAGCIGLLHQSGFLDDPKCARLRTAYYPKARLVARFQNELRLFAEVNNQRPYSFSVLGPSRSPPEFLSISNVLHPSTIHASLAHDGRGELPGLRLPDGSDWDHRGHHHRIVEIDLAALSLFARMYGEPGTSPQEAPLPILYSTRDLRVMMQLANAPYKLESMKGQYFATQHFNETSQQADGTLQRATQTVKRAQDLVICGPHIYVATPLYKTPNENCSHNKDYSPIDLTSIPADYLPRTNHIRACSPSQYQERTPRWKGRPVTDFYRHANRSMLALAGERTLIPAIIPPGPAHIDLVFSLCFEHTQDLLLFSAVCSSLPVDFMVRTTGKGHAREDVLSKIPLPVDFSRELINRALILNSLTSHYASLWEQHGTALRGDGFSKQDSRLKWPEDIAHWTVSASPRTAFARRQALVEIDALTALAFGLSADELCDIYRVHFQVMRQYEADTFYDQSGRIVFTTNRGLAGVGLSRPDWEEVRSGRSKPHIHEPPYHTCDREEDMRAAFSHFLIRGNGGTSDAT